MRSEDIIRILDTLGLSSEETVKIIIEVEWQRLSIHRMQLDGTILRDFYNPTPEFLLEITKICGDERVLNLTLIADVQAFVIAHVTRIVYDDLTTIDWASLKEVYDHGSLREPVYSEKREEI